LEVQTVDGSLAKDSPLGMAADEAVK
jgi:hypothetical protein